MENLPVSPHLEGYSGRSTSPARSRGHTLLVTANPHQYQVTTRQHANTGKKSEPLVGKSRHRSPVPGRKGPSEVQGLPVNVAQGSSSHLASVSHTRPAQEDSSAHGSGISDEVWSEWPILETGGNISNGSSMEYLTGQGVDDSVDSGTGTPDIQRTRAAIEQIRQKIQNTKEMITQEQKARDENVDEYLRLASSADKQQIQRIKSVFEKKNQKSAQTIAQLQKKLENYPKRIRELEMYGVSSHYRQPKEVLRDVSQGLKDVGANIREGISGLSGTVMAKPREFAHLIKNKFGSADNINSMTTTWFVPETGDEALNTEEGAEKNHHHNSATFTHSAKYTSDDECSSVTSGSGPTPGTGTMSSPRNQTLLPPNINTTTNSLSVGAHTMTTTQSGPVITTTSTLPAPLNEIPCHMDSFFQEYQDKRDEWQRIQDEVDALKSQVTQDIAYFNNALLEEKYRYERLEEQMNDLIELHQNEIENLKQGISDMEEKLQYQSEERLRDIHEMMDGCQTRISRMEQQLHEKEQLVTFDGIENSNARAVVLKLINVLLTFLQVILLLVATASNILMPFLKTRFRILTTTILVLGILLAVRQWPHWMDFGRDFIQRKGFL